MLGSLVLASNSYLQLQMGASGLEIPSIKYTFGVLYRLLNLSSHFEYTGWGRCFWELLDLLGSPSSLAERGA